MILNIENIDKFTFINLCLLSGSNVIHANVASAESYYYYDEWHHISTIYYMKSIEIHEFINFKSVISHHMPFLDWVKFFYIEYELFEYKSK